MVQLTARPVLSQPESGGWCRTAVLAESSQTISLENQPVWLISVASETEAFAAHGMELLKFLEQTYHSLELKSAEALYQSLAHGPVDLTGVAVAACCVTLTTVTIITKKQARAILMRERRAHDIVEATEDVWQAVEGDWHVDDIWWLEAGAVKPPVDINEETSAGEEFARLTESLTALMGKEVHQAGAGLLFHLTEHQLVETENEAQGSNPGAPSMVTPVIDPIIKKKRRILGLGIILLILLFVSVFVGSKQRQKQVLERDYQMLSVQVDQSIAVAQALYQTDQVKAREQMRLVLDQLDQKKEVFARSQSWLTKWTGLYDKAHQTYITISGEVALTDVPVWYPLKTIKPNFMGNQMELCGTDLVVWDEATKTLVSIDSANKRNDIIAGGEAFNGYTRFACDGKRAVVLVDKKIVNVSLSRPNVSTLVETDPELQQPMLVGLFNNNVYVVDAGAQTIWRYPAITGGVGQRQNWFGPGVTLTGNDYVKMAIDGQLWLLQSNGSISRYTRGAPQRFTISGLDKPLGANTPSFAVDLDRDLLAILDSGNNRIIITTKNGQYQKQIEWAGVATANDIAFLPNQDTLFVLNQGNIYAINF